MYQDYMYQKSRSPQNINNGGPAGKVDYYKMINSNTQSNFGLKGAAQVNYTTQQQMNHSNNSNNSQ